MALEPAAQRAPHALIELVQALRSLSEPCPRTHQRRAPVEPAQPLAVALEPPPHAALEPHAEPPDGAQPLERIGYRELRGRRGRGRAHVGGKIGDGEIDLMADAADHGDRRCDDGACQASRR